ncbi:Kelch repeat-containing protein [Saccharothrix yanglingensis]|uniref:Kelch-like protein 17 n=1 Tax=Saccharothrix yanglingensis TaxID=659496 RepID=A0ABU0X8D9_9PSEU|nr:kelch repeat-containing protein [Saccharothrix yanglingensis]MDQ2588401.1 Kelch-like protein 17 [Saccharothrix yanglingensis]
MTTGILAETWSAADDYVIAACWRGQHDAPVVLSGDTKLLVAGGADATGASLRQSALFDFAAGEWSAAVLLGTARQLHASTLLPDGKVLATGGVGPGGAPLATAEIYDPVADEWAPVANGMAVARFGHSATTLSNGLVLVAGGSGLRAGGGVLALRSSELFDPATGMWQPVGKDMADARTGHTAVAMDAGKKVLVCGGSVPLGAGHDADLAFCELYDTVAGTWQPTATMRHPRSGHSATALTPTTVLVAGGRAPGASGDGFDPFARATAEVYNLNGEKWTDTAAMPAGRAFHRAVPFGPDKALVIGGADHPDNETGYRGVLQYASGTWTPFAGLAEGRWAFAAAASGTKVLVAGGITRTGLAAATGPVELTATAERSET